MEENNLNKNLINTPIKKEMEDSYLSYAMSVIVSRALPDARDGLKPVHRRIFYGMMELDLRHNAAFKKSARIVGEVMGKYHPHGDTAIYDTMVRMAQPWSLRYTLVDGQGNFGSIDGDSPAAYRYTEARMKALGEELLVDIDKETVDFQDNFDGSLKEPTVLPAKFPNLLVNGSDGIAVGMATKIAPHNLREVIDALFMVMDKPHASIEELMTVIHGPDFPTGGYIVGRRGIIDAFKTGRGRIIMRAKTHVEDITKEKEAIIVTEIPYQVNKTSLIESIADLVRDKKIEGITDLRDESDKKGMRIVIELRRGEYPDIVLNHLLKLTSLQSSFSVNSIALVQNRPEVLNLPRLLSIYISHRFDVVTRRTRYELRKAEERAHILRGLKIALENIDEVIQIIKTSSNTDLARERLMERFEFSEIQAKAILAMRLSTLTNLETQKIIDELEELEKLIAHLKEILANRSMVFDIIKEELTYIRDKYGDERRSEIIGGGLEEMGMRDLVPNEAKMITITNTGYLKVMPLDTYTSQNRGGKGSSVAVKEDDFVTNVFTANTYDYILFFTNKGRCFARYVYALPEGNRLSRGRAIVNLLALEEGEKVTAMNPVVSSVDGEFDNGDSLVVTTVTKRGIIKSSLLSTYNSAMRENGVTGIRFVNADDEVVSVRISEGNGYIVMGTYLGKAIRFLESEVRVTGRVSMGVIGIKLDEDDYVIGMEIIKPDDNEVILDADEEIEEVEETEEVEEEADNSKKLLVVTENGYSKRSKLKHYRLSHRAGKGVYNLKVTRKVGNVVSFMEIDEGDHIILISTSGKVIRIKANSIPCIGRATQGVKAISLAHKDLIVSVSKISGEIISEDIEEITEEAKEENLDNNSDSNNNPENS